jgi:hypothetical protein
MRLATKEVRERPDSSVLGANRLHPIQTAIAEAKARQARKIKDLKTALIGARLITLDEQARALGLCRSTAWAILNGAHKTSGLSASIVSRMLSAPELPSVVRRTLLEYVQEKINGAYGHSIKQSQKFSSRLFASGGPKT